MKERVAKLRKQSVETRPYISTERAELLTEFYKSDIPQRESVPVCRALSFKHLMENKTICINDGELIVGERGPAPKRGQENLQRENHSFLERQNHTGKTLQRDGAEVAPSIQRRGVHGIYGAACPRPCYPG
jgi:hypothetical protein